MKLVQKILSHGLLIAFIVATFFVYTNRADLFPQWFGKTENAVQQAANEKPDEASAPVPEQRKVSRPKPEKTVSKKPVAPLDEKTGSPAEEAASPPAPAEKDERETPLPDEPQDSGAVQHLLTPPAGAPGVVAADTSKQVRPVQTDVGGSTDGPTLGVAGGTQGETGVSDSAQTQATAVAESTVALAQAPGSRPAETTPAKVEPVTTAQTNVTEQQATDAAPIQAPPRQTAPTIDPQLERQLEEARRHYWQRDLRGAAAAYQALSRAYPDNPDVWGEMGNFYFNQRQREPASAAYSRCIELLIDQGEPVRASQLLNVLYRLDALKARELETRLQQAGG